jgi:4-amino-4-deoxy-L-arabinose transferase-like glycosyltransferase
MNATKRQLVATHSVSSRERVRPARLEGWLIGLAIFLLALAPRALALGRFVTIDEAYHWFDRARLFGQAVRQGDWAATNLIGHPGVTTMWLGAAGRAAHQALAAWGLASWPDPELLRTMLRLPVALVTALCVALGYGLLRRLLPGRTALLAALLWAADPFLVAHSQLLHVDALLTSFVTLSLLAALLAFGAERLRWRFLIGSAVAGGLALLTKSPAIVLPPMVGLIALVGAWRKDQGRPTNDDGHVQPLVVRRSSFVVLPLLVWLVVAALTWFALWPAAWVDPLGAIGSVVHQAEADGGTPHGWGNFFLGRAVADPGPLFYPLAIALRLAPWTLLGLVGYCGFWTVNFGAETASGAERPRSKIQYRVPLALLNLFVLLFVLMLTLAAKKFDRYALPIFPALDILAAAGLIWLLDFGFWIVSGLSRSKAQQPKSKPGWLLALIVLAANLAWYHPYELAYYNPLLGGGAAAAQLIPVGWGEGLEQAGAFIAAQPDGAEQPVATWYRPALKPYIKAPLVPLGDLLIPGRAGYAVLYIDQVQRRDDAAATDWLRTQLTPIHTVRIHGIDYAEIYQVPMPAAQPLDADFGPAIHLRGYDLDLSNTAGGTIGLTVHWQARAAVGEDLLLFVHVLGAGGARVGGADLPPGGADAPTSAWQPGRFVSAALRVPIQPNLAPGSYWLSIGVYRPGDGARLDLRASAPAGAPDDGPHALLIGPIVLK